MSGTDPKLFGVERSGVLYSTMSFRRFIGTFTTLSSTYYYTKLLNRKVNGKGNLKGASGPEKSMFMAKFGKC